MESYKDKGEEVYMLMVIWVGGGMVMVGRWEYG